MIALLLCALLALATEAPPPAEADPALLLDLARSQAAAGDEEGARDLAEYLSRADVPDEVRREARQLYADLHASRTDWQAVAQLAGWQTAMGAWLGGPNVALSTRRWVHPSINLAGMVGGGALGAAAAVYYAHRWELTPAKATAIMGTQQLGVLHGIAASMLLDQWQFGIPVGVGVGAAVGTVGGYLLAATEPDDGLVVAAYSGVFWGAGLGTLFTVAATAEGWEPEDDRAFVGVYSAWVDAGALGLYLLARGLDLDRDELRMANLGGVLGTAAGGLLVLTVTLGNVWWQAVPVAVVVGVSAVAGGIVGASLVRRGKLGRAGDVALPVGALVHGVGDDVRLGLPAPAVVPVGGGVRGAVSLVDYRF